MPDTLSNVSAEMFTVLHVRLADSIGPGLLYSSESTFRLSGPEPDGRGSMFACAPPDIDYTILFRCARIDVVQQLFDFIKHQNELQ